MPESLAVLDGADAPMRALVHDPAARRRRGAQTGEVNLVQVARPQARLAGWVRVRPALSGISRSDLALLAGEASPVSATPPGLPIVPGREIIGVVEEACATRWAREGQRVLVEPNAGCAVRGFPTCGRCHAGEVQLCENRDRPSPLGPAADGGLEAGGGWSEAILVPEEMLVPADGISDQRGVLGVSLALAIHAVLRWQRGGDHALVIGSGTTTRLVVAALHRLHPEVEITAVHDARGPQRVGRRRRALPSHLGVDERSVAGAFEELGAARLWRGSPAQVIDNTARLVAARRLRLGNDPLPTLDRGVDVVFDCKGTAASIALGLHLLRAGGSLILAGRTGRLDLDWSAVWTRQLSLHGIGGFGREPAGWRTFAAVREWLTDPTFPVDNLVTHRYPLDAGAVAVATARAGEAMGAVKVVFEGPDSPLRQRAVAVEGDEESVAEAAAPVLLAGTAARVRRTIEDAEQR